MKTLLSLAIIATFSTANADSFNGGSFSGFSGSAVTSAGSSMTSGFDNTGSVTMQGFSGASQSGYAMGDFIQHSDTNFEIQTAAESQGFDAAGSMGAMEGAGFTGSTEAMAERFGSAESFGEFGFATNGFFNYDEGNGSNANNGWGNGDQDAPGNSGDNNNAENAND